MLWLVLTDNLADRLPNCSLTFLLIVKLQWRQKAIEAKQKKANYKVYGLVSITLG